MAFKFVIEADIGRLDFIARFRRFSERCQMLRLGNFIPLN